VQAIRVSETEVELRGAGLERIEPGKVAMAPTLANMREGLAIKVDSLTRSRDGIVVKGDPASLLEIWKHLDAKVVDHPILPPEGQRGRDDIAEFQVPINDWKLIDNNGRTLSFDGKVAFKVWFTGEVNLGLLALDHASFLAKMDMRFEGRLTGQAALSFSSQEVTVFETPPLPGILLGPLYLYPYLKLRVMADGKVNVGAGVDVTASVTTTFGMEYQGGRWRSVGTANPTIAIGSKPEVYASAKGTVTLLAPEVGATCYGTGDLFLSAELPRFYYSLEAKSNPASVVFDLDADFLANLGARIDLLGARYEWLSDEYTFFEAPIVDKWTWTPSGGIDAEIK